MNKTLILTLAALAANTLLATPTVSNVTMEQLRSRTVKVTYTLDEDAVVTLDVLTNASEDVWVSVGAKNIARVWGDGNRLVKGAGVHTLYWAPEKSWRAEFNDHLDVKALVKAWAVDAPPDYMTVDLTTAKTVRYYETAEQVPGGVTNDIYKTDVLLMRKIPAKGVEWRMGSPTGEVGKNEAYGHSVYGQYTSESTHYVTLTNDYYLGVYELTQRQCCKWICGNLKEEAMWMKPVGGDNGAGYVSCGLLRGTTKQWPGDGHEVDSGSGIAKLRTNTGVDFDLPTEAQWEFACRAGEKAALYNGQELTSVAGDNASLNEIAWYAKNSDDSSHVVGLLKPNGFGLYDMLGNVAEFTLDRLKADLGSKSVTEPVGAETGDTRVLKGGAYSKPALYSRAAFRQNYVYITHNFGDCGFRLWAPAVAK